MRLVNSLTEIRSLCSALRKGGKAVALVPTMGALHEGHLSLMRRARAAADVVIVSIFVNPTQFGPSEDLDRYPRNLDRDLELLRPVKPEAVFAPRATEMYPPGFSTWVMPGSVAAPLEGTSRPGHFRGVATVVLKLLNLVNPDIAFFGQKDFQQVVVIRRMVADFDAGTRVVMCPTLREPDGLAVSSRNAYLNAEERKAAPVLFRSLRRAQELFQAGETRSTQVLEALREVVLAEPRIALDYAAIVDPSSMEPVEDVSVGRVALMAARLGSVRLIDNVILGPAETADDERIALALGAGTASQSLRSASR